MKCDWCGMSYPDGMWDCYYYLKLWGNKLHIICCNCYDHLSIVVDKEDIK